MANINETKVQDNTMAKIKETKAYVLEQKNGGIYLGFPICSMAGCW
jgi:hypothetical protein